MKDATHDAVTPTVMRTFPTASNRGDLTMRELVDAYMAAYGGRDGALAQRLNYWVQTIGAIVYASSMQISLPTIWNVAAEN